MNNTIKTLTEMRDSAIKALDFPAAKVDWKVQQRLKRQAETLSEAILALELLEAAKVIQFPLPPDETYYFTSISRYNNDSTREYFGKWKIGNDDYEHDSATAAYSALKENQK